MTRSDDPRSDVRQELVQRVEHAMRENHRLLERLGASERQYRRLARAVWKVQEDERRRIARELHDDIGQTLTALSNHLQRISHRTESETLRSEIRDAVDITTHALQGTRELSRLLRPAVLDDLGLELGLRWLARFLRERSELHVEVIWDSDIDQVPEDIGTMIFRVVQEALTNTIRHAEATRATVQVQSAANRMHVAIEDNGRGFFVGELDASTSTGLRGVKDRVEMFAGRVHIDSARTKGTRISFSCPLDEDLVL